MTTSGDEYDCTPNVIETFTYQQARESGTLLLTSTPEKIFYCFRDIMLIMILHARYIEHS